MALVLIDSPAQPLRRCIEATSKIIYKSHLPQRQWYRILSYFSCHWKVSYYVLHDSGALLTIAYRTHPLFQTVLRENYAFKYPCIHVPHRVLERHVTVYDRIFHVCQ